MSRHYSVLLKIFPSMITFISAPSRIQYIQKYIHSMIKTMVVRLPYILENPLNTSRYIENTQDMTIQPTAANMAPGS